MAEPIRIADLAEPRYTDQQRALPLWEAYEPVPTPGERPTADRTDPRYARCAAECGVIDYWSDRIAHLLEACARDRHLWPAAQSIDVPFHEFMADDLGFMADDLGFMADDLGMVRRIYAKAGMEMNKDATARLRHFIRNHPRDRHGRVAYNLQQDFGIDPDRLRQRFAFYFRQFPVQPEQ